MSKIIASRAVCHPDLHFDLKRSRNLTRSVTHPWHSIVRCDIWTTLTCWHLSRQNANCFHKSTFANGLPLDFRHPTLSRASCRTPSTLNLLQHFMTTLCGHEEQIWNAVKSDTKCALLFDCVPGMPTVTMLRLSHGPKNIPYPAMAFFFPLLRQAPSTISTSVLEGIVEDVRLPKCVSLGERITNGRVQ